MLAETGPPPALRQPGTSEPAPKRLKRPGQKLEPRQKDDEPQKLTQVPDVNASDDEDGVEFEDVQLPAPVIQTTELDSEDEDDEEIVFEDIDIGMRESASAAVDTPKELELNLSAHQAASSLSKVLDRRKPLTRQDRMLRLEIHKVHVLCLLSHVAKRNHWCNDTVVRETLGRMLTNKLITYLNPPEHLPQFGRSESLKKGVQEISVLFKSRFEITERGMWRALWAEDPEHLEEVCVRVSLLLLYCFLTLLLVSTPS